MAFKPDEAKLGPAPTGTDGPSYTQMLSSLFEEIRKAVKGDGKEAWLRELKGHRIKIEEEITKNDAMVAKMEKEEKSKITSEGLHEGFNTSVTLPTPPAFYLCLTLGARCQTVHVDKTASHRN
jgi:cell division cycle protein 37